MTEEKESCCAIRAEMSLYEGFKVETDPFILEADKELDLEQKWISLAQHLLNETNDKK